MSGQNARRWMALMTESGLPPLLVERSDQRIVAELRRCGLWGRAKAERKRRPGKAFAIMVPADPAPLVVAYLWCVDGWLSVTGDPVTVMGLAGRVLGGPTDKDLH